MKGGVMIGAGQLPTRASAGAAILALVIIVAIVQVARDPLYMWYVMVRELTGINSRAVLMGTAVLLSIASVAAYMALESRGMVGRRRFGQLWALACLVVAGFVFGAIVYIGESLARVGMIRGNVASLVAEGTAIAAVTVAGWVGVSIAVWLISVKCLKSLERVRQLRRAS